MKERENRIIFPKCPEILPDEINESVSHLSLVWKNHKIRPRINNQVLDYWDKLISEWIKQEELPLYIRRVSLGRGSIIIHNSGRKLIPTDNSPASWSYLAAYMNYSFSIQDVKRMIQKDNIPIAMILKRVEKENAVYKNITKSIINKNGWKVCHIEPVGFNTDPLKLPIEKIEWHFKRFLSPSNMFLVPKTLGGLGELPQMIESMR